MRSLYAGFYSGSTTQLWLLRDWLDRTERQQLPGYTTATAEAEDASERAAVLALKNDAAHGQLQSSNAQPFGIKLWFRFRCIPSHDTEPTRFRREHKRWERVL